jgi:beta-lactamase class A
MNKTILLCLSLLNVLHAQNVKIPEYYKLDDSLSAELKMIVTDLELNKDFDVGEDGKEQVSLAVIDMTENPPHLGGVNVDNFIYPASVYKMYVAAEILDQISQGIYGLARTVVADSPNVVDTWREIQSDPRPLLQRGDTVTVNYLLDLMITRSDNSAANCLIDLAGRKNIDSLLHYYGWYGSEVTRKFLKRKYEDPGYEKIRGTETCALHAADFLYRIHNNQLVNPWVSMQMKTLLGRQLDKSKLASGLPPNVMFYHKTGWFAYWTHDAGIVLDGKARYIVACFLPLAEDKAVSKFRDLSVNIYDLMTRQQPNEK